MLFGQETEITLEQENPFTDVDDPQIRYLAQRGIVAGHGNGIFAPQDGLTRQQAAVLLTNAARDFGRDLARDMSFMFQSPMSDRAGFAAWAAESIAWVRRASIMTGTTAAKFDPQGQYTREQAIITMLRFHDVVIGQKDYRNFQNLVISLVPTTIENDVFVMYIPANVPYERDIEKTVLQYIERVQKASGLSFFSNARESSKLYISFEQRFPFAGDDGIYLGIPELYAKEQEYTYTLLLSHTLLSRSVSMDSAPSRYAFAVLNSAKTAKMYGRDYLYWYVMHHNFSFFELERERNVIGPGLEDFFRKGLGEHRESSDDILTGFRFGVYLEEQYGDDILAKLVKLYAQQQENTTEKSSFVDLLKEQTSPKVFDEFVSWYWKNRALFVWKEAPAITERTVSFRPRIDEQWQAFLNYWTITFEDSVTLDLRESHALAQLNGYKIKAISVILGTKTPITITSFDKDGNQVEKNTMRADEQRLIMFPNAATLVITGANGRLFVDLEFGRSYFK